MEIFSSETVHRFSDDHDQSTRGFPTGTILANSIYLLATPMLSIVSSVQTGRRLDRCPKCDFLHVTRKVIYDILISNIQGPKSLRQPDKMANWND